MASEYAVEKKVLFVPKLEAVAKLLNEGLKTNFEEVSAEVVDCPDLRSEPFTLACKGLGGSPGLIEVGGPPYLLPLYNKDKVYNIDNLSDTVGLKPCLIIGAGAGPWFSVGQNCEMIANVCIDKDKSDNQTRIAKVKDEGTKCCLEIVPSSETGFALLANLYCCKGKESKVIRVRCKKRLGSDNFITAIRTILEKEYKEQPVGLGGTFLMKSGKAKYHIMPDFSKEPLKSEGSLNEWLRFFDFSAPLVSVGTLISTDIEGMDLRLQHFHSFSNHGEGGHYHYDITPNEVEYEGYFNIAEYIFRVDKPIVTHKMGRD